jgi:hypothetical protein
MQRHKRLHIEDRKALGEAIVAASKRGVDHVVESGGWYAIKALGGAIRVMQQRIGPAPSQIAVYEIRGGPEHLRWF